MDIYTARPRYSVNPDVSKLKNAYPRDLQLYDLPPTGIMSLAEFEQLGLDRVKVLQHVESMSIRSDLKTLEDRKKALVPILNTSELKYYHALVTGHKSVSDAAAELQARKKDHIAHFIIRLAYCGEEEKRRWFITQEVELFKMRYTSLDSDAIQELLQEYNLCCTRITQEEKESLWEDLNASSAWANSTIDRTHFYKVPFQNVCDIVRKRRAYIKDGIAYISQADLLSVFVSYFKQVLQKGLEAAKRFLGNISDDERLEKYIRCLPHSFAGITRVIWNSDTTPIEKLDELSKTSYPLCMRTLHEGLRRNHHLKNQGRIQYGLFIKGIGVTLEDAIRFWRDEFTKNMDLDKFEKQYVYNIKHIFGKEGKRTNYTPLSCQKIITHSVGPGEYHGCPYRHMDRDALTQKLMSYGLPPASVTEIVQQASDGHYHLACGKYFEVMHSREMGKPCVHPNSYFAESRDVLTKREVTDAESSSQKFIQGRQSITGGGTPVRRYDQSSATPGRLNSTPSRLSNTPSRSSNTPLRRPDRLTGTPARKIMKTDPLNIEQLLDEDIGEFEGIE